MSQPIIIIDDKIPYIQGEAERLGICRYMPGAAMTSDNIKDADMLIVRTRTHCNAELLDKSKVRYIVTATIGFDHIDTSYLAEKDISWTNCPGCNAQAVAQYVESCLQYLKKLSQDPSQTRVGVVGKGNVGSAVYEMLQQQHYDVVFYDPFVADNTMTLEELAATCDLITFHTPLTFEGPYPTYHMASDDFFYHCRRQPVILNAARGGVIDEVALLHALEEKKISCAIIDTWEHEPTISAELLRKAYIATPHIAGYSADGKSNATRMALQAAARFLGKDIDFNIQPPALREDQCYNPLEHHEAKSVIDYYDPMVDTMILKQYPALFEQLRGNYPLRREAEK